MHYNIKIKSKNSEFSLDSANKDIMQREADLYFAHIFNASEDFIANIKTIEFDKTTTKYNCFFIERI